MNNMKVLVLEGGHNEEHEISLATGKQVKKALSNLNIEYKSIIVSPNTFEENINKFSTDYICFNALHGPYGEDGTIQKILDDKFFRYTHSDAKTSHIGFNKELTKKNIKEYSITTPDSVFVDYNQINKETLFNCFSKFGPFVIKPVSSGSSFGIKIFKDKETIDLFLEKLSNNLKLYNNHRKILIEKYINGRELTVAVVDLNNASNPIEVTEILTNEDFFDYKAKYTQGYSKHILPAKIPDLIYEKCLHDAQKIHKIINCKGVSRTDFIYDEEEIYFLEINTQPGLTPVSLVPEQLGYQNVSFDELIYNLIKRACEKELHK